MTPEQVREACAEIADAHASIEGIAQKIAAEIRALPLPDPSAMDFEAKAHELSWSYPCGENNRADREQLASEIAAALREAARSPSVPLPEAPQVTETEMRAEELRGGR